ncbi:hypothetical protein DCO49_04640 [Stenotrophomonas sp. SPM]|nr:hypothetical protein DCO49_04640 [Stenotrophomonas sp. SPM]
MSGFNDRISAQRSILSQINRVSWPSEPLHSLSQHAIDRWIAANRIEKEDPIVLLVSSAAKQLLFLANKSQDQITETYLARITEIQAIVADLARRIELELGKRALPFRS